MHAWKIKFDRGGNSNLLNLGADITRAKNKTTGRGSIEGETAKKALGESLDPMVANLQTRNLDLSTSKGPKAGVSKAAPKPKPKKVKSEAELKKQKLDKDIKASPIFNLATNADCI